MNNVVYEEFKQLKIIIGNRPVVLSMSGGYDSRFIGCMLKNVGVNDVSCFAYGKEGSFEIEQSRKNAEALGYRWTYVEHTDDLVKQIVDEEGLKYLDSYSGHDYSAYYQNYPSVRYLHEKGWFKPGSVFITGLCGDMPTGEYVVDPNTYNVYNIETAADFLYHIIYDRYEVKDKFENEFKSRIKKRLLELPIEIKDYQSWVSATDCIYTGSVHVHAFMRMNHVHDYFGYEWLLPYWNKSLLNFWYSIPAKYRINQRLYGDWLMEEICKPYGLDIRKTDIVYPQNKIRQKILYTGGGILSWFCLNLGIPFKRHFDFNNWAPLELELFKRLESKKMIEYSKASVTNLIARFCLQRRYGSKNVLKAQKNLIAPK